MAVGASKPTVVATEDGMIGVKKVRPASGSCVAVLLLCLPVHVVSVEATCLSSFLGTEAIYCPGGGLGWARCDVPAVYKPISTVSPIPCANTLQSPRAVDPKPVPLDLHPHVSPVLVL